MGSSLVSTWLSEHIMESVASNSGEDTRQRRRGGQQKSTSQALAERLTRALRPGLLLLHRSSESTFFVMGSTCNVYTVVLSSRPRCSCPDRATPCKHILFVMIRVLGVPHDDPSHRRPTLRPCQLSRLFHTPSSPDSLAHPALCRRFHQLFSTPQAPTAAPMPLPVEDGSCCPVCLEDMRCGEPKLVACRRCRNPVHDACFLRWKRSLSGRWPSCVICRARWRNSLPPPPGKYLNLAPYFTREDAEVHATAIDGCVTAGSINV